jgi:hypothetical protein
MRTDGSVSLDACRSGLPVSRPIAENRCAAFFVSPVAPDSETDVRQQVIEHLDA